jgi:hypothetical protein
MAECCRVAVAEYMRKIEDFKKVVMFFQNTYDIIKMRRIVRALWCIPGGLFFVVRGTGFILSPYPTCTRKGGWCPCL